MEDLDAAAQQEPLLGEDRRQLENPLPTQTETDADSIQSCSLDAEAQGGIQQADAVNLVWTRRALVLTYCFIFVNFCVNSMQQQTASNLMPYVVSDFSAHSLIPAIGITSFILSGVLKLPIAKLIDTWGRPQGFVVTTALATLGLALTALCRDVKTYAAAQILHSVGFNGFSYILDIIIADTSSLQDRALAFAFAGAPYIATTFLGPPAAQWFLRYSSWRVAFALFAIITPLVAVPVLAVLQANTNKALRLGVLQVRTSKRTGWDAVRHYAVEFDGKQFGKPCNIVSLASGSVPLINVIRNELSICSCRRVSGRRGPDPLPAPLLHRRLGGQQVVLALDPRHAAARHGPDGRLCRL